MQLLINKSSIHLLKSDLTSISNTCHAGSQPRLRGMKPTDSHVQESSFLLHWNINWMSHEYQTGKLFL